MGERGIQGVALQRTRRDGEFHRARAAGGVAVAGRKGQGRGACVDIVAVFRVVFAALFHDAPVICHEDGGRLAAAVIHRAVEGQRRGHGLARKVDPVDGKGLRHAAGISALTDDGKGRLAGPVVVDVFLGVVVDRRQHRAVGKGDFIVEGLPFAVVGDFKGRGHHDRGDFRQEVSRDRHIVALGKGRADRAAAVGKGHRGIAPRRRLEIAPHLKVHGDGEPVPALVAVDDLLRAVLADLLFLLIGQAARRNEEGLPVALKLHDLILGA